jgi:FHA domain/FhaA, N-terminal domain
MKESKRVEYTLDRIESSLQSLIEGNLARLFHGSRPPANLAHLLVQAMWENAWLDGSGVLQAPNYYLLEASPSQADLLSANQAMLDELANILKTSAQDAGLAFPSQVVVLVSASAGIALGEVRVTARNSLADLSQTRAMELEPQPAEKNPHTKSTGGLPPGAFLIVDGTRIFSLTQTLVNIGRHPDNHLVIDDPRVSRQHAQLRVIEGRFVLFDLNSKGGTQVNGRFVNQSHLTPGDVISLAGLPLVYGQEDTPPDATQQFDLSPKDPLPGAPAPGRHPS